MNNDTVIYWEEPQRQSPAAIFIILLKTGLTLLKTFWPALVVIFFGQREKNDNNVVLYVIIAFAVLTLVASILNYFYYTFHVKENNLVINSGFFRKKVTTLPLRNIIAVHLEQNLWQRALKVMKVKIDSAGSEKMEVKIDALALQKSIAFREYLLNERGNAEDITEAPKSFRLSPSALLKLSITANHLEAFFILLAVGINLVDDLEEILGFDSWKIAGEYAGDLAGGAIAAMLLFVTVLSVIISAGRTLLKYFDFSLAQTPLGWKVHYGLLNRVQQVVPYQKVQLLSWRANFLRRKLDMWVLKVHSTGHSETREKQHIGLPVIGERNVWDLVSFYLQPPVEIESGKKISKKYVLRKILVVALPVTIILSLAATVWLGLNGLVFLLIFPLMCIYFSRWQANFRYVFTKSGLQVRSGVWGRRYTILAWKKIQLVEERRSIYQMGRGLSTIVFHTAGGALRVPFVEAGEGALMMDLVLYYVETDRERWK